MAPRPPKQTEDVFWSRVQRGGPDECWLWQGAVNDVGYGVIRVNGRSTYVHRYAYELEHGPLTSDESVLHRCDTPLCVNTAHHFIGDRAANNRDKVIKRRQARGAMLPHSKLNATKVYFIRRRSDLSAATLARMLAVTPASVRAVRKRKSWKEA